MISAPGIPDAELRGSLVYTICILSAWADLPCVAGERRGGAFAILAVPL